MSVRQRGVSAFVAMLATVDVITVGSALTRKAPSRPVTARIIQAYASGARFPKTVIIAAAPHAMDAHAILLYDQDCRLGDTIRGVETGVALRVDPQTCARPQTSSTSRP